MIAYRYHALLRRIAVPHAQLSTLPLSLTPTVSTEPLSVSASRACCVARPSVGRLRPSVCLFSTESDPMCKTAAGDATDVRQSAEQNEPPEPSGNKLVDALNNSLHAYPMTTSMMFLYHNLALASVVYGGLTVLGVSPPPSLGVAFAINKLTTRFRLPVIVALAAMVAKVKPEYSKLQLSKLMTTPILKGIEDAKRNANDMPEGSTNYALKFQELMLKGVNALNMGGVIDKLGLSYVLCGRAVATTSILGIWWALENGLDITPLLEWVGESGAVAADWMSRWTLGCLMINVTYPLVLRYVVADLSMFLGKKLSDLKLLESLK